MQSLTVARLHPVLASGTLVLENEVSSERFCPISPSEKKKFFFCILRDAIEAKRVLSGSCVQDEPPTRRTKIKTWKPMKVGHRFESHRTMLFTLSSASFCREPIQQSIRNKMRKFLQSDKHNCKDQAYFYKECFIGSTLDSLQTIAEVQTVFFLRNLAGNLGR